MATGSSADRTVAYALAAAFLAGDWTPEGLRDRGAEAMGARRRWIGPLVREVLAVHHRPPLDRPRELAALVAATPAFLRAAERARSRGERFRAVRLLPPATRMVRRPWPVPRLDDVGDLCTLLDTDPAHLAWLADPLHRQRRTAAGPLHHYRYRWRPRPHATPRLVEAPLSRLADRQRTLLREVLEAVPVHPSAHGFVAGRGVATAVRPHAGAGVLVCLDLAAFFASVTAGRVYGLFRAAGYPEEVAHHLTGLVTVQAPVGVLSRMPPAGTPEDRFDLRQRLRRGHLPTGAPTSPALANLASFRLDARISGLADSLGAVYTRYADDLIISGPPELRRGTDRLVRAVTRIVAEEGFAVRPAKTRVRARSQRQQVLGAVVNDRPTVPREEYDRLRAVLHNARRSSGEAQNRDGHPDFRAHLTGRVAWVTSLDPVRGARLRAELARVAW
jgi:RNA-directed DNA polymerase